MNTYAEPSMAGAKDIFEQREGPVARAIEKQTSKIPSDIFLWAAGAAVVGSLALEIIGAAKGGVTGLKMRAPLATFVGMWVPSLLLLGVYNKIVKVAGSDRLTA